METILSDRFTLHRLRFLVAGFPVSQDPGKIGEACGYVDVLVAEKAPAQRERFACEPFRLGVLRLESKHIGKLGQARRDLGIPRSEHFLAQRQRFLLERLRLRVETDASVHHSHCGE